MQQWCSSIASVHALGVYTPAPPPLIQKPHLAACQHCRLPDLLVFVAYKGKASASHVPNDCCRL